jgi:hypothetical protein
MSDTTQRRAKNDGAGREYDRRLAARKKTTFV